MKTKINPQTLILINIILPIFIIFLPRFPTLYLTIVLGLGILVYEKKYKRCLKFIGFIAFTVFAGYISAHQSAHNAFYSMLSYFSIMDNYAVCFMTASLLIFDTTSSQLVSALEGFHLPKKLIIAITIALRYIPIFSREFRLIRQAMKLRGIEMSWKHPIRNFEFFIVPQLFRCSILSEELTCAGLTRGLDAPTRRSSYTTQTFKAPDAIVLGLTLAIILGGFYVKYRT